VALKKQYHVHVDGAMCKGTEGCGLCLAVCDQDVLRIADSMNQRGVHPVEASASQQCNGCTLCVLHCPDLAIWLEQIAAAA
jgi:2-oxoglutarate ferredoxin oxidoreductase subunit delta